MRFSCYSSIPSRIYLSSQIAPHFRAMSCSSSQLNFPLFIFDEAFCFVPDTIAVCGISLINNSSFIISANVGAVIVWFPILNCEINSNPIAFATVSSCGFLCLSDSIRQFSFLYVVLHFSHRVFFLIPVKTIAFFNLVVLNTNNHLFSK